MIALRSNQVQPGTLAGFTMLEVLVSLFLFSLFAVTALSSTQGLMRQISSVGLRTEATSVAARKFDELRELNPDDLPSSGTTGPETISGGEHTFSVYTTYCADVTLCPSTRTRHIGVDVHYDGATVFYAETVYTRLR